MNESGIQRPGAESAKLDINEWRRQLPERAADCLRLLEEKLPQLETFDLLSNISFYNHLHNADKYEDNRDDKMFVVSELIALLALKKDYVKESRQYEKEFRYIKLHAANAVIKFPAEAVKEIYLDCMASLENIIRVEQIRTVKYPHAKLISLTKSNISYSLQKEEMALQNEN